VCRIDSIQLHGDLTFVKGDDISKMQEKSAPPLNQNSGFKLVSELQYNSILNAYGFAEQQ
jgi:hypothetical protein